MLAASVGGPGRVFVTHDVGSVALNLSVGDESLAISTAIAMSARAADALADALRAHATKLRAENL